MDCGRSFGDLKVNMNTKMFRCNRKKFFRAQRIKTCCPQLSLFAASKASQVNIQQSKGQHRSTYLTLTGVLTVRGFSCNKKDKC